MPYFIDRFGDGTIIDGFPSLSTGTTSLVVSILSAGTFVGALAAYPLGDALGRRIGILIFLGLFSIGVACQTGANCISTFIVGRVFAGLGVGGTSCLVPVFQSECAPRALRGAILSCYQLCITIGLLIAAVVVNATKDIDGASSYQIPIGLQFIWAAILAIGLFLFPESPRWLILKGRSDDAQRSLARLLSAPIDSEIVQLEYQDISQNCAEEQARGQASYLDCFTMGPGRNGLRVGTGMALESSKGELSAEKTNLNKSII